MKCKIKYGFDTETFWGVFKKFEIEEELKNFKSYQIINNKKYHIIKNEIYNDAGLIDIVYGIHLIKKCSSKCEVVKE